MAHARGLFAELRRRHSWRVTVAYLVAGWLLIQIATQVFPFFKIPDWSVRLVVLLIALGFPVAVVLAWIFEMTPEGVRRTEPADSPDARSEHQTRRVARQLNAVILTVLILAVALLGWRVLVLSHAPAPVAASILTSNPDVTPRNSAAAAPESTAGAAASGLRVSAVPAAATSIPEKSVAVLPFSDESEVRNDQFFSDGLSEDLITALSQFAGLKVISRNSSFQFRRSTDSAQTIGLKLGVAHLLEGSVRRQRDTVRISAALVNAADGSIMWSQQYDKSYKDLFALQDDITHAVASALQARLLHTSGAVTQSDRPASGSLAAYSAYLQGKFYFAHGTEADDRKAIAQYTAALKYDPRYALAYAELSQAWTGLANQYLNGDSARHAYAQARTAAHAALQLDADLAAAHGALGYLLLNADFDWTGAQTEYRQAAHLAQNDGRSLFHIGNLSATLGRPEEAVVLTRQALTTDPLNAGWYNWLANYLSGLGRLDEATAAIRAAIEQQPSAVGVYEQLVIIEIQRGNPHAALAAAEAEPAGGGWREIALALARQIGPDRAAADATLKSLIGKSADLQPYQIAEVYALRRDPDRMFSWLDHAWVSRDPGISYLLTDPFILRYQHDPRFAVFCRKVGLPTTTTAKAML
jgi:TolB-like protein/Tfp pilus assembly protein PilF